MAREQELKELLSRIMGISVDTITDSTAPDNVEKWDSLNGLLLVTELEKTFNTKFTVAEVTAVTCVGDIKNHLRNHGIDI